MAQWWESQRLPSDTVPNHSICDCKSQNRYSIHTEYPMRWRLQSKRLILLRWYYCDWTMTANPGVCIIANSFRTLLTINQKQRLVQEKCNVHTFKLQQNRERKHFTTRTNTFNTKFTTNFVCFFTFFHLKTIKKMQIKIHEH